MCYVGSCPGENSEDPPHDNSSDEIEEVVQEEQPQTELVKQEMLVQYLQDAYNFSVKITEALNLISKMMYENSVSGMSNNHGAFLFPFTLREDARVVELQEKEKSLKEQIS